MTISHVLVLKRQLFVQLTDREHPVPAEQVEIAPTELVWPRHRLHLSENENQETRPAQEEANAQTSTDDLFALASG